MKNFLKAFIADETGASAAEYALILAIVGVGIGGAAVLLGNAIEGSIDNATAEINAVNSLDTGTGTTTGG